MQLLIDWPQKPKNMTLETQVSENIASFAFAINHSAFKKKYMEDNDKAVTKPANQPLAIQ